MEVIVFTWLAMNTLAYGETYLCLPWLLKGVCHIYLQTTLVTNTKLPILINIYSDDIGKFIKRIFEKLVHGSIIIVCWDVPGSVYLLYKHVHISVANLTCNK